MERFLYRCAEYIYKNHPDSLHEVCVVFPNRRAGAFFNAYLQKQLTLPVIGPKVTTVNEFISGFSDLQQGEKLLLISELYGIFIKHTTTNEGFDDFYFWGEVLLSDFNDIDRYLTDAKDLFTNVSDLKEVDQLFDYLTPEQKEAISYFWGSIPATGKKMHHQNFISIWSSLHKIYTEFKAQLEESGIAYPGMIYRQVAEKFLAGAPDLEYSKYYIVGLNAMNNCEKLIFKSIKHQADFLWDYDNFYLEDSVNEAGNFLRDNLKLFPPPVDFKFNANCFLKNKNIRLVAVPSNYGQAQEIPRFLQDNGSEIRREFDNCAIVLADESLLFPALGAIPEDIKAINVTMGYPVKNSMVYGFLLLLVNLLKNHRTDKEGQVVVYHRFVTDILNHQMLIKIAPEQNKEFLEKIRKYNRINIKLNEIDFSPMHQLLFSLPENVNEYSRYFLDVLGELYKLVRASEPANQLLPELIHTLFQSVEKIGKIILDVQKEQSREISEQVYFRLFSQYAGQSIVAFEGEPVYGMQVMGILETRCLDFDNLIILGLNENKWPRTYTAPSFIPYNLRKGFGLPGADEQNAMYAYYFLRLVQRAKNISATYSTLKEGINTGELSRYGYQLLYDSAQKVKKSTLDFQFTNEPVASISVIGSAAKTAKLLERNSREVPLSPTAINMWLQCRLRFYFRYILQLDEPEEMKDEIDSPVFGRIFHETIERLYKPLIGKTIERADLERIKNNKVLIENEITRAIGKHYFRQPNPGKIILDGKTVLIFENIKIFLQRLIEIDMNLVPFELILLEERLTAPLSVLVNGRMETIYVGGVIDRIDKVNGNLRIIDYKTGNVESFSLNELGELFEKDTPKQKKEILQALIYCMVYKENFGAPTVLQPAVYSLRRLFEEKFSPELKWNKANLIFQDVEMEFSGLLKELISEIFSHDNFYSQTPLNKYCQYCAYNKICQKY